MITLEEAVAIVEDRIITGQLSAPQWAALVLEQDELYYLLKEPHGFNFESTQFNKALDELEIKLFGVVVSQ